MSSYVMGIDFGTLSVRALLADLATGRQCGDAESSYAHGILRQVGGNPLPVSYALQNPTDYWNSLRDCVQTLLAATGVPKQDIIGIGIDCTASTVLPVDGNGFPLCLRKEFSEQPQAYVKLWKHHGAVEQARRMQEAAEQRGEPWLRRCGGRVNAESLIPKSLELAETAPDVYEASTYIMEAGDWIVSLLTGEIVCSRCGACCNALYDEKNGYPSDAYLRAVSPAASGLAAKLKGKMTDLGACAGALSSAAAEQLGLCAGTPVSSASIDSHASFPACGADREGDLVIVVGTSACHLLLGHASEGIPGVYSAAPDSLIPGMWGYEAGQSCAGDGFGWFVNNFVPESYAKEARLSGMNLHEYLSERAAEPAPGENRLLALDWFNGFRSPGMDTELTGVILGLTLQTRPEAIYRSLLEASAMGTRRIIEQYAAYGQPVRRLFAAGGIASKNPLFMQILADVCGLSVAVCGKTQTSAWGSAVCAASASGRFSFSEAMARLSAPPSAVFAPRSQEAYETLYQEYIRLSDYFARENPVMKVLRRDPAREISPVCQNEKR